ncbi:hypothetical protein C8Q77DRAFT_751119 [Trametes polyzona]|nr:hypothetical protein C8Q77DRAFT_751119 [Trametes polyzona]
MPARGKKQAPAIFVRTVIPGTRQTTKTKFGTMTQLNKHQPVYKPETVRLKVRKETDPPRAGRGNGEWLSSHTVCGRALGPEWGDYDSDDNWRMDVEREWDNEDAANEYAWGHERMHERTEVCIMDIAKPMKPRGISKKFEVVDTVRRVMTLEEDQETTIFTEWDDQFSIATDIDLDDWDILDSEDEVIAAQTYAESLRRRPR